MKKIIWLIPLLFIILGCADSELIIPGENLGEGNTDGNPVDTESILNIFTMDIGYESTQAFTFNLDKTFFSISSFVEDVDDFDYQAVFIYTDGQASSLTGLWEQQLNAINIIYDDADNIAELSNDNFVYTFNQNGNNVDAVINFEGNQVASLNFGFDGNNRLLYNQIINLETNDNYEYTLNYTSGNLSSVDSRLNGNASGTVTFDYDDKINPISAQATQQNNLVAYIHAAAMAYYVTQANQSPAAENYYQFSFLASSNNPMQYTKSDDTVINFELTYGANDLPESGVTSSSSSEIPDGNINYLYYPL